MAKALISGFQRIPFQQSARASQVQAALPSLGDHRRRGGLLRDNRRPDSFLP
jgi:hypothetical protein